MTLPAFKAYDIRGRVPDELDESLARRIGVAPEHCRAFEDTDLGLTAIRAAGMDAVDIRDLIGPR